MSTVPSKPAGSRRMPRQERAKRLAEAVREAGRQLLDEFGPEALTTTRIAERAGVSVGSLYQYFENKEAIFKAIYEEANEEDLDGVETWFERLTAMPPEARLRVGVEFAVDRHRRLLGLAPTYYREHHDEYRVSSRLSALDEAASGDHAAAIAFAEKLIRAEPSGMSVNAEHAAFILGRGISAILRAALEDCPDRLSDPSFVDEIVKMMTRYLYPDSTPESGGNEGAAG